MQTLKFSISVLEILWSISHWKCSFVVLPLITEIIFCIWCFIDIICSQHPRITSCPWNKGAYFLQNLLAALLANREQPTILFKDADMPSSIYFSKHRVENICHLLLRDVENRSSRLHMIKPLCHFNFLN